MPRPERSTSCRLFDKFAISARAAMCSLQLSYSRNIECIMVVSTPGLPLLAPIILEARPADRRRVLCGLAPLICLQLIRIVDVAWFPAWFRDSDSSLLHVGHVMQSWHFHFLHLLLLFACSVCSLNCAPFTYLLGLHKLEHDVCYFNLLILVRSW